MAGQLAKIRQQIAALEKKAQDLVRVENNKVIEKVKGLIAKHGLSADDLGLVDAATGPASAMHAKQRRKSVGQAGRGSIGVAMYRDPTSGKTWTGRGKPPAWIAGAADRAPFLIGAEVAPAGAAGGGSEKSKRVAVPAKTGQAARTPKATRQTAVKAKAKRASSKPAGARKSAAASRPADTAAEADVKPRAKATSKRAAKAATKKGGSAHSAAAPVAQAPSRKKAAPSARARGQRSRKAIVPSSELASGSETAKDNIAG